MTCLMKYGLVNFANRSPGLLRSMRLAWKIQKFNVKISNVGKTLIKFIGKDIFRSLLPVTKVE